MTYWTEIVRTVSSRGRGCADWIRTSWMEHSREDIGESTSPVNGDPDRPVRDVLLVADGDGHVDLWNDGSHPRDYPTSPVKYFSASVGTDRSQRL